MSLGNALPTETTTATIDSCSILQTETNERGKSGQRAAFYAENMSFINVSGDSLSVNHRELLQNMKHKLYNQSKIHLGQTQFYT